MEIWSYTEIRTKPDILFPCDSDYIKWDQSDIID